MIFPSQGWVKSDTQVLNHGNFLDVETINKYNFQIKWLVWFKSLRMKKNKIRNYGGLVYYSRFSWFKICSRSLRFLICQKCISVSSANKWKLCSFDVLGKSFIYSCRNNRGPRMDPWGTPQVIERESLSYGHLYLQTVLYCSDMNETNHRLYLALRNDPVLIKKNGMINCIKCLFRSIKMPQTNSKSAVFDKWRSLSCVLHCDTSRAAFENMGEM